MNGRGGEKMLVMLAIVATVVGVVWMTHGTLRPLVCQVWSWQKMDWKTVRCWPEDPALRGNYATEAPTATDWEWYTATATEWEPAPYASLTPTPLPTSGEGTIYPGPEETWTPEPPYPLPLDILYWWRRSSKNIGIFISWNSNYCLQCSSSF